MFDAPTLTATRVAWNRSTKQAAILDSVLDYVPVAGRIGAGSADKLIASSPSAG